MSYKWLNVIFASTRVRSKYQHLHSKIYTVKYQFNLYSHLRFGFNFYLYFYLYRHLTISRDFVWNEFDRILMLCISQWKYVFKNIMPMWQFPRNTLISQVVPDQWAFKTFETHIKWIIFISYCFWQSLK